MTGGGSRRLPGALPLTGVLENSPGPGRQQAMNNVSTIRVRNVADLYSFKSMMNRSISAEDAPQHQSCCLSCQNSITLFCIRVSSCSFTVERIVRLWATRAGMSPGPACATEASVGLNAASDTKTRPGGSHPSLLNAKSNRRQDRRRYRSDAADQQFALVDDLGRQVIVQLDE
jgi:hypothetical protein